jgi:hypothetical protein
MCAFPRLALFARLTSACSKQSLNDEENMVLSHIQASSTQGKPRTTFISAGSLLRSHKRHLDEAHQDQDGTAPECPRSLPQDALLEATGQGRQERKGLARPLYATTRPHSSYLQYPTRKIYMLANLEPSVELTGGPWYTDNEFDTEFIKNLCAACLRHIRDCVHTLTILSATSNSLASRADIS